MKRLTPEEFFDHPNCPVGAMPEEWEHLFDLMQAYADHCEESAWISVDEQLPPIDPDWSNIGYSIDVVMDDYIKGFYDSKSELWICCESGKVYPCTKWRPL